jgi:hypothetical protein
MATYRGFWIICRSCKFPIRLPNGQDVFPGRADAVRQIMLACPVCAHVHPYRSVNLERTHFRTLDPFIRSTAILYLVKFHCAFRSCSSEAAVRAVAASSISVAQLLGVWKFWRLHARCETGHTLRAPDASDWVISRQA